MTNQEISQQIAEIGQMLEILNANNFKIIAYERAARIIDMNPESLDEIFQKQGIKGLKAVKGIGQSIAEKIEELIKTGKIKYHEQLVKKVPKSIIIFSSIPGVGPKTAKKLYEKLRAKNIVELKEKLQSESSYKYFKPKTRAKIIDGISIQSQIGGRMLLSSAEIIATDILETLKRYPEIENTDLVGSLRRMKETIGDIDIVASPKNENKPFRSEISESVINKFCKEKFIKKIVNRGDTKAAIIHTNGTHIDLEILPKEEYGSLLQHFTGSKDHNIALRTYADKNGFSISEHGIKKLNNNPEFVKYKLQIKPAIKNIKCKTEKEVYKTLKMDYIEPEMRENQGEIEVSLKHKLPRLVKLSDIRGDLQMHSTHSDGENSIAEMAQACKDLGYEYLAITDHPSTLGITRGLRENEIDKYIFEIRRTSHRLGIKIFSGIEANIKPNGDIDLPNNILSKFDIVLGAIHSSFRQDKKTATTRLIRAIENPHVRIIAHPSGRIINRRPPINLDWHEIFIACNKNNTMLEVNSYPDRLDLRDSLIKEAINYGVKIIINTDSHSVNNLKNMRYGVAQSRRGWAEKKNIVNTLNLKRFSQLLNIPK